MPTVGGLTGYNDWQKQQQQDTPSLINDVAIVHAGGSFNYPVLDVRRFARLFGLLDVATTASVFTFVWSLDQALAAPVGTRFITIDPVINAGPAVSIPNLGPWVKISVATPIVGSVTSNVILAAGNRELPYEFIPAQPILLSANTGAMIANATVILTPTDYWSGPVTVVISPSVGTATWLATLQALATNGSYTDVYKIGGTGAASFAAVLPPAAWRLVVQNGPTACTVFSTVTPSLTGAS